LLAGHGGAAGAGSDAGASSFVAQPPAGGHTLLPVTVSTLCIATVRYALGNFIKRDAARGAELVRSSGKAE